MSEIPEGWREFDVASLGITFRYPQQAGGEPIEMDDFRAHFRTMKGTAAYFEVSRHTGLTVQELYDRETAGIRRRDADVRISEQVPARFAGQDAVRFTVTFPDRERIFTLIPRGERVYRVIYDPRSRINHEVVETMRFE